MSQILMKMQKILGVRRILPITVSETNRKNLENPVVQNSMEECWDKLIGCDMLWRSDIL